MTHLTPSRGLYALLLVTLFGCAAGAPPQDHIRTEVGLLLPATSSASAANGIVGWELLVGEPGIQIAGMRSDGSRAGAALFGLRARDGRVGELATVQLKLGRRGAFAVAPTGEVVEDTVSSIPGARGWFSAMSADLFQLVDVDLIAYSGGDGSGCARGALGAAYECGRLVVDAVRDGGEECTGGMARCLAGAEPLLRGAWDCGAAAGEAVACAVFDPCRSSTGGGGGGGGWGDGGDCDPDPDTPSSSTTSSTTTTPREDPWGDPTPDTATTPREDPWEDPFPADSSSSDDTRFVPAGGDAATDAEESGNFGGADGNADGWEDDWSGRSSADEWGGDHESEVLGGGSDDASGGSSDEWGGDFEAEAGGF